MGFAATILYEGNLIGFVICAEECKWSPTCACVMVCCYNCDGESRNGVAVWTKCERVWGDSVMGRRMVCACSTVLGLSLKGPSELLVFGDVCC